MTSDNGRKNPRPARRLLNFPLALESRPTFPTMPAMRKTKILCTLGPATESAEAITELIAKGADIFRLNMSHASHDWVRTVHGRIREAAAAGSKEIAILMDLTGPSIRTGDLEQPWQLQPGDAVEFRCLPEVPALTSARTCMPATSSWSTAA
jgi:pyruvate kinase